MMTKKFHIHIYETSAMAEIEIEAGTPREARQIVRDMLNNKPHSDINESDFKKPDTEYIIMTFNAGES